MNRVLYSIREDDNVATAFEELSEGTYDVWTETRGIVGRLEVMSMIPQWFKVATKDIRAKQNVIKFGYPIGTASVNIRKGDIVHRCNVVFDNHERIMKDPLVIENKFEIGTSTDLILEGTEVRAGSNAVLNKELVKRLKDDKVKAQTNIPTGNTLYCGNLLEAEICRLTPQQVKEMLDRYSSHIKKMEEEADSLDFEMFSRQIYTTLKFYRMLKGDFSLVEIAPVKKRSKKS